MFLTLIAAAYIISSQILPLEQFKNYLDNYFDDRVISHKKWFKFIRTYVSHLFNCSSCISFWLILLIMGNWQLALIGYVVAGFVSKHLNSVSF